MKALSKTFGLKRTASILAAKEKLHALIKTIEGQFDLFL